MRTPRKAWRDPKPLPWDKQQVFTHLCRCPLCDALITAPWLITRKHYCQPKLEGGKTCGSK